MPVVYISGVWAFLNNPPWISFTPFSHLQHYKITKYNDLLKYGTMLQVESDKSDESFAQ